MPEDLYYIQNVPPVGNCARWWRIKGNGYTCDLDEAWKVPEEQAKKICRSRPLEDIPRLASDVDAIAQRHVDVQRLFNFRRCSTCGLKGRPNHPLCESCDTIQDLADD